MESTNTAGRPRTFIIDIWRDSSIWTWEGVARSDEEARGAALEGLCADWGEDYPDWEEMAEEMDGTATRDLGDVMADRIPQVELNAMRSFIGQVARMSRTDEAEGVDLENDAAMDGLIRSARIIAAGGNGCETCTTSIETRALPCDECGRIDDNDDE